MGAFLMAFSLLPLVGAKKARDETRVNNPKTKIQFLNFIIILTYVFNMPCDYIHIPRGRASLPQKNELIIYRQTLENL
ncbi:MAG: hypothetical protein KAR43_05760 [Deltaproteobacteria bacterium]|nr:hypothetical protein [Deltaproteobacteria bacterium]